MWMAQPVKPNFSPIRTCPRPLTKSCPYHSKPVSAAIEKLTGSDAFGRPVLVRRSTSLNQPVSLETRIPPAAATPPAAAQPKPVCWDKLAMSSGVLIHVTTVGRISQHTEAWVSWHGWSGLGAWRALPVRWWTRAEPQGIQGRMAGQAASRTKNLRL